MTPEIHVESGSPQTSASICANFGAHPELVRTTHLFLEDLSRRLLCDDEATERVSLTLNELLENLCKYGGSCESSIEVVFSGESPPAHVRIRTSNRTTPDRLRSLQQLVDEMRSYADPTELYDHVIRTSVDQEGSGLGLARICAEADMQLSFSICGSEVTIQADSLIPEAHPC